MHHTDRYDKDKNYEKENISTEKSKKRVIGTVIGWILFMIIGLGAIAIFLALNHSYFNIDKINIQGNFKNTDEEIIESLGFQVGDNILKIDLEQGEKNILNKPGIDQVEISRIIPNTINISLKEVLDIGYIQDLEHTYIVDKDGNVKSGDIEDFSRNEIIEFKSVNTDSLSIGMNIAQDPNFAEIINNLKLYDYYTKIDSIDLGNLKEIEIVFHDGIKVILNNENIQKDLKNLSVLLKTIDTQGINAVEIIMNVGENPVIIQMDEY